MPSNIWLIDSANVAYYLSGPGPSTVYNGSGTPWTVQATSPMQLSMNDKTGQYYTPQAPEPIEVYGGGPPFQIGSDLVSRGYSNVVEEFGLQLRGSSHNNAVNLLRLLRRVLAQSTWTRPAILAVQPNNATNVVYFNIYGGKIQETPSFINEEAGATPQLIRCNVTWTRSPFGSRLSTGETLINSQAMTNNGTGSPNNVRAYSAGTGDMITEGSPLSVRVNSAATVTTLHYYLATVFARTYRNIATAITTSSTTGTAVFASSNLAFTDTSGRRKPRMLLRLTNPSANLQIRILVYAGIGVTGTVYTSPWIDADGNATAPAAVLLDMGTWSDSYSDTIVTGPAYIVVYEARSTNGAATSGTLAASEFLEYYTFCEVVSSDDPDGYVLYVDSFRQRNNEPTLPIPPISYNFDGSTLLSFNRISGTAPRYIEGSSLWLAQFDTAAYDTTPVDTFTVTVTHAPLYETLRGNG